MRVTRRQKKDWEDLGWFHLGRVFDDSELAEIRAAYDEVLEHPMKLGEQGKGAFDYAPLLQFRSPVLLRYATSSKLVEPIIALLGPDVRLYWDQAVRKPPGGTSDVPWHQDNGYTQVEPENYVTYTLALDATTTENGCLWIQPGSHRHGVFPHIPTDFFFQVGYDGAETGVPVAQEEGDLLIFSSLTLHRTGPNLTNQPRRSWVIQFCHGEARNRDTGVPFTDRLLVARDGKVLAEPYRERPFDFAALARQAARNYRSTSRAT